jgi:hypothetical protein
MSINTTLLYCDMSTLAQFTQWTTWVSGNIATVGWTQTKETGQVMWSGMSLSAVSMSGSNATYTYGSLTGMPLQNGRALTITGMTNSANNGVFIITGFTGTTSGTFTVVNALGVNESGSTGVVTKITSVPGNNAYVYEMWQPNDGLTPYLLKLEYGSYNGGTNNPTMRLTLGITTNGSGTFYGSTTYGFGTSIGAYNTIWQNYGGSGTSVPYPCYFSGDTGRLSCLMWRGGTNNAAQMFSIERSVNASGAWTGAHVTLITAGNNANNGTGTTAATQATLHFTYGGLPAMSYQGWGGNQGGLTCRSAQLGITTASMFVNQQTSIDTVAPYIGYFDYPLTTVGLINPFAIQDGQTITVTLYGSTRTYLCSNSGYLAWTHPAQQTMLCMRYD